MSDAPNPSRSLFAGLPSTWLSNIPLASGSKRLFSARHDSDSGSGSSSDDPENASKRARRDDALREELDNRKRQQRTRRSSKKRIAKGWKMTWVADDVPSSDTNGVVLSQTEDAKEHRKGVYGRFERLDASSPQLAVLAIESNGKGKAREEGGANAVDSTVYARIAELEAQIQAKEELIFRQRDALSSVAVAFTCKVCLDITWQPWVLRCGHSFCASCLRNWFTSDVGYDAEVEEVPAPHKRLKTCPHCRMVVVSRPIEAYLIKDILGHLLKHPSLLPLEFFPCNESPNPSSDPLFPTPSISQTPSSTPPIRHPWGDLFPENSRQPRVPFAFREGDHANVAAEGDLGWQDEEDGGVYRCTACMHEIFEGTCSNDQCSRVYPAHNAIAQHDGDRHTSDFEEIPNQRGRRGRIPPTGAEFLPISPFRQFEEHDFPAHVRAQLNAAGRRQAEAFYITGWPPTDENQPHRVEIAEFTDLDPDEDEDEDAYESDFIDDTGVGSSARRGRGERLRMPGAFDDGEEEHEEEDGDEHSDDSLIVVDESDDGDSDGEQEHEAVPEVADEEEEDEEVSGPGRAAVPYISRRRRAGIIDSDVDSNQEGGSEDEEDVVQIGRHRRRVRFTQDNAVEDDEKMVERATRLSRGSVRDHSEDEEDDELSEGSDFNTHERDMYGEDDFVPRRRR